MIVNRKKSYMIDKLKDLPFFQIKQDKMGLRNKENNECRSAFEALNLNYLTR